MAYGYDWRPYVPVAERRRQAARTVTALKKKGRTITPVSIDGRSIARTFWGKAWCDNLESYSDYANRLPRGRTYVRNGSVVDLQITPGRVTALVSGSSMYEVGITIKRTAKARWRTLANRCAGKIDSVVELLQGRLSRGVMEIIARRDTGLFPSPREISLTCTCPDWATMCKHVAAVLYGVGARLDDAPRMLFVLRGVDHMDLVARAGSGRALGEITPHAKVQVLRTDGLGEIFGIELADDEPSTPAAATARSRRPLQKKKRKKKKKSKTKSPRTRTRRISSGELVEMGVPRSTFQNWVTTGVLVQTRQRGVYLTTATTGQRIKRALRRRARD